MDGLAAYPRYYTHNHSRRMGLGSTRTYSTWKGLRQRCENSRNSNYPHYGGRGIAICERWRDFENFIADMGERPDGMSLDRIDNDGNYEASNCRWATQTEQNRNRRVAVITADLADEILGRLEHGESARSIARRMGLGHASVLCVRHGQTWNEKQPCVLPSIPLARSFAELGRQTHCRRGHEFTPSNTYVATGGHRHCRPCARLRGKK